MSPIFLRLSVSFKARRVTPPNLLPHQPALLGHFLPNAEDTKTWMEDSAAFLATCGELKVPAALERSRAPAKAQHIWIFSQRSFNTAT
jgi:hypothetical protein